MGICVGPDGNIWFTRASVAQRIGRITLSGAITEFVVPREGIRLTDITAGPDGNLWFTGRPEPVIGRVTPSGVMQVFLLSPSMFAPSRIVTGPDSNLWFTNGVSLPVIGRMTVSGVGTAFTVPQQPLGLNNAPLNIAVGPDGNMWFPAFGDNIGRITPSGIIMLFPIPEGFAEAITAGPDGNMWFTRPGSSFPPNLRPGLIGRITPSGEVTTFTIPIGRRPAGITTGPDGNLWFTERSFGSIGRLTLGGAFSLHGLPIVESQPGEITAGPDGNLWFPEEFIDKIGRMTPDGVLTQFPLAPLGSVASLMNTLLQSQVDSLGLSRPDLNRQLPSDTWDFQASQVYG
jgi:streptogramin lyase